MIKRTTAIKLLVIPTNNKMMVELELTHDRIRSKERCKSTGIVIELNDIWQECYRLYEVVWLTGRGLVASWEFCSH